MDNNPYLTGNYAEADHDHLLAEFESPFTLSESPTVQIALREEVSASFVDNESPFLTHVHHVEGEMESDPEEELFVQFLDEIEDDEFNDAVIDLKNEVERYAHENLFANSMVEGEMDVQRQEEVLMNHLQPLALASENFLDQVSREFAQRNEETMTDEEFDELFDRFTTQHDLGNPAQEFFFKKFKRWAKKAVKKGRSIVRKVKSVARKFSPVHILLNRLKKLVRPFLGKLIGQVIGRLPGSLQGPARRLAQRFGIPTGRRQREVYDYEQYDDELYDAETGSREFAEHEFVDAELYDEELETGETFELINTASLPAAAPEPELLARELNLRLTEQLFARDEQEAGAILQAYADDAASRQASVDGARLEAARERFVRAMSSGASEQEVQVHVEEFVGTVLLVIRTGIRLIGRKKVINFIAKIFTKMIAKLIGPQAAQPLARAIVEKGFDLLRLELEAAEEPRLAGETIAQVLEELTMQVSTLDEEVLDNSELLEQEMREQFNQLIASNFPSSMVQEELRESETAAAWTLLPARGQKRYKKYGKIFDLTLPYDKIKGLRTFGGQYLQSFLRRRHGHKRGDQLRTRIHIYEAIRGTTLSHISMLEKGVPGLGSARRGAWSQIHFLDPRTAGQLLGNPALGRKVSERWQNSRHRIQVRQRFYYLEVLGSSSGSGGGGVSRPPVGNNPVPSVHPPVRRDEAMVKLDFTRSTMTLALMMTEEKAAEITRRIRANDYGGAAMTFRTSIRDALNNILLKHAGRQVKVVMETREELYLEEHFRGFFRKVGAVAGKVLKGKVTQIVNGLMKKLVKMTEQALVNHLKRLRGDFIRAQEDGARGVSLHLVFIDMPGMAILRTAFKLAKGKPLSVGDITGSVLPSIPMPDMRLFPGRKSL